MVFDLFEYYVGGGEGDAFENEQAGFSRCKLGFLEYKLGFCIVKEDL